MSTSLNSMLDSLAYLDLFKRPFGITLNGKRSIKTNIGGLATLFTVFLFSIAFILKIDHMNTLQEY